MAFGGGGFGTMPTGYGASATVPDVECSGVPTEPISCVAWAPLPLVQQGKNLLAAGSWDKTVRVWEVRRDVAGALASNPSSSHTNDLPVFDVSMSQEGQLFYGGGCQTAKMVNLAQAGSPPQQVASHDLPVKSINWCDGSRILLTGGWDGRLKMWDCKSATPGQNIDVGAPVVDMDVTGALMTVATARTLIVYDLFTMREVKRLAPFHTMKDQLRCVANFQDKQGFAAGSIEGRICIMWLDQITQRDSGKNFSFKCHRENDREVFSVNSISFHPEYGTLASAGSNGGITIWDKAKKACVKAFRNCPNTISCGKFDASGSIYGYAASYDWTKGAAHYNPQLEHKLYLKPITEAVAKPKPKK